MTAREPIPPVPEVPAVPASRLNAKQYLEEGGLQRAATIENVFDVLSVLQIARDRLSGLNYIGVDGKWRPFTKVDYSLLRMTLGRGGFKAIPLEIIRSAVELVAAQKEIDSGLDWIERLVWDGTRRIAESMITYFGCEPTPFARAVGDYVWSALAGRVLSPGVKADMAVLLVGPQGCGKSTGVAAIAPTPEMHGEIDLAVRDAELVRAMRGKLVVEMAEMRGLRSRDLDAIKAFITRQVDEHRELYDEFLTRTPRRSIIFGTSNTQELLDDDSGERRWLPLRVGEIDVAAIVRDREQLWAEGAQSFREYGVSYWMAEQLAGAEHEAFKTRDTWFEPISAWLKSPRTPMFGQPLPATPFPNGAGFFTMHQLLLEACQRPTGPQSRADQVRAGKVLRSLGYVPRSHTVDGVSRWGWGKRTPWD